ncbi:hypothetical protein LRF89_12545 [Halorhodospira sp. 9621]|uniref:hypothetical protein n=1 Tax=Halorhodospira sp. 9621 TaxID=2899135 RepID=UPI001EE8DD0B|nr:hypothetical protein [Halorhodospira sp. 9621]MCG5534264.1 hypothetical protein [Halorhodospira sp. 9621]
MHEAHCAELEVSEVLSEVALGDNDVPDIRILDVVNDDDSAVNRLREVMGCY